MSDRRDQASEELLPDELVNDAGELDDVSTVYNEEMFGQEDLEDSPLNRTNLDETVKMRWGRVGHASLPVLLNHRSSQRRT